MAIDVLVELAHVFSSKTFTYHVPENLLDKIEIGMRVTVPFGNQVLEGFIMAIKKEESDMELKDIIAIVDSYPILNNELLKLGHFIKSSTLCTLMSAYQAMLPLALKAKNKVTMAPKKDKYIRLSNKYITIKLNENQEQIINLLKKEEVIKKSLLNLISSSSVNTLIKKGILLVEEHEVFRYNLKEKEKLEYNLNESQKKVYDEVLRGLNTPKTYLLHGITGSGKTNVYMSLIEKVVNDGKTAILLVPEISLTPQIISRLNAKFDSIAVMHSGLSDGEKYDEWRKIREGKVNIVVGARSAIFAPLLNIGIIIIDEEHSQTYKQENNPRYHAADIAKQRSLYHNCPVVLGSATPVLESYARAKKDVYKLLTLNERFNQKELPKVEIIDMNESFKKVGGYFSDNLINEINQRIKKDEQVILFLNRRGYSSMVMCKSCGYTEKCPNCDISLTFHKTSNMLRCHYCGYATSRKEKCPECKEEFKDLGLGTQKAKEELEKIIPEAKIIRMDIDTTTKKNAHEKIINDFNDKKYNILLGTQMIAKGLDFPDCTLVGVINADISLNFPDFRASENTFSLLNQVSGRAGRDKKEGKVLIQTFNPDHYAIKYAKYHDYLGFYEEEMKIRKILSYPPYYYICHIKIISSDYEIASSESIKIGDHLKKHLKEIILGPSVANVFKLNNKYRFQIIIKYKDINNIIDIITKLEEHYFNKKNIKLEIDFNPVKL